LAARAASLREAAQMEPQPSVMLVWPEGCQPLATAGSLLGEKLWEDILLKFLSSGVTTERDAQYFEDVINAGMDANLVPFPAMSARQGFSKIIAGCPASRTNTSATYQDAVPFPFLRECANDHSNEAEKESRDRLVAGLAKGPEDLRKGFYSGESFDMELVSWPSLQKGVIAADECTDTQSLVWELRAKRPLSSERVEKRRANLAKKLQGPLNREVFAEVRPQSEREAAILEWRARHARDKAIEARQLDELAEQGATFAAWVIPYERRWPEQPKAWKQFAKWFKMWRARPTPASTFAFEPMKRSASTSSLNSWAVLSDVSWVDLESKASECGWQEVMDEQVSALLEADPADCLCKADITELKSMTKPPELVKLTMEVVCIMLEIPAIKLKGGSIDYWHPSKTLLGDVTFLARVSALRDHVSANVLDSVSPYMAREDFMPENVQKVSKACKSLCLYLREVYKYQVLAHASAEVARQEIACTPVTEVRANMQAPIASLSITDIQELKSLAKPPRGVDLVCECLLHLFAGIVPQDLTKKGYPRDVSWRGFQKFCNNPAAMLTHLQGFQSMIDTGKVPRRNIKAVRKIQINMGQDFTPQAVKKKSTAAAGLCTWLIYTLAYYDQVEALKPEVEPVDEQVPALPEAGPAACLCKADITEMKSMHAPPAGVKLAIEVICVLLQVQPVKLDDGRVDYWPSSKALLADACFFQKLRSLGDNVAESALDAAAPYMAREDFTPDSMKRNSAACSGLCEWAHHVYQLHGRTAARSVSSP
jgi:hypothetical protein